MMKALEFLMVEDNPADIRLTQEFFKEYKIYNCLHIVPDETEALRLLRHQGEYVDVPVPDVVFISIVQLWRDGNLLQQLETDPNLPRIPVVVLTASDYEAETLKDDPNIQLFLTKPLDMGSMFLMIKNFRDLGIAVFSSPTPADVH